MGIGIDRSHGSRVAKPMLIVNGDDWGYDAATTDLMLGAYRAGLISSVSAMVDMADSERAASLALDHGVPVGLHLNMTEPFTGPTLDPLAHERQLELTKAFSGWSFRWRRWLPDPRLRARVDRCITDQVARFRELYGSPPTHFDGHNHVHICPVVFRSPSLPAGMSTRKSFLGARQGAGAPPRLTRNRALRRRFTTPDHFFSIHEIAGPAGQARADQILTLARSSVVEVMAHPGFGHEMQALSQAGWVQGVRGVRVGSVSDLGGSAVPGSSRR